MANAMQKKTFKGLIAEPKNTWSVPEIQREYVWGANVPLLDHFFKDIAQQSLNYNIGFLYSYNPHIAQEKSGLVHLIDGQQRFTTLYLAAFYFSLLEGKRFEYAEKFSYRVRNSTAEFLSSLIDKVNTYEKLENLEDQTWFLSSYRRDASIQNMCALFSWLGKNYPKADGMLEKIMGVEFWNFNLNEAHQGEELYITMNSRGESLSSNENIRAYLMENENPQNKHSLGKEFDNWQEFFWKYRGSNPNADKGFNAFLAWVIFIELHKSPSDKLLYILDGFQEIVDDLYNYAQKIGLTFDKIRPYYIALEQLTELIERGGLEKITPKLFGDKNPFGNYLSGSIDMRGLVFLLPLLAFYSGHSQAKPNNASWVRFFYNITFNQESLALEKLLTLACKAHKEEWQDTTNLLDFSELAEEERAKLEQLKGHPTQREELEQLFQELENHPITKGSIASFISKSLDDGQLNKERLKKYGAIFDACFAEKSLEILMRRAILASALSIEDTFLVGSWYYSLCRDIGNKIISFSQKSYAYFNIFDKISDVNNLEQELNEICNSNKEYLKLPIWAQYLVEDPHFLETFYTVSVPNEKNINWLTSWDKRGAWYEFYTYRLARKNKGFVPYYKRGWTSGAVITINNFSFYLYYDEGAYPLFSLWIESKSVSSLKTLEFFEEGDWHYIDGLKSEDEVLVLVEKIKEILI